MDPKPWFLGGSAVRNRYEHLFKIPVSTVGSDRIRLYVCVYLYIYIYHDDDDDDDDDGDDDDRSS